ncbi:uncharacterized protein LOC104583043 [Brachypodium distachyon]|uniref:uncharacterized protein LOC104583043 n=1 Tax=Brachypodium distachyon TaxID=15368 RepID=UPI00052FF6AF|nr:uncharacterized protein LOC104583043 [Brachypodium distachyon]|eukprot:XP_010233014.1 uncharacterized protein LOC104583043 [Brachypodium distachyon]
MYIRQLNEELDLPWLMLGAFNEIMYAYEKDGGNPRPLIMMQKFRECIADCGLEDMGFFGDVFTWSRNGIRERLDRAVCNERWAALFPMFGVINEAPVHSDHRPIVVDTEVHAGALAPWSSGTKFFEARWLKEETVETIVNTAWAKAVASGARGIAAITKLVHEDMHTWDCRVLKGPVNRIKRLKQELEEIYWMQRGRANWLLHGDRNNAFFHHSATQRKKRNHITKLIDESGIWHEVGGS